VELEVNALEVIANPMSTDAQFNSDRLVSKSLIDLHKHADLPGCKKPCTIRRYFHGGNLRSIDAFDRRQAPAYENTRSPKTTAGLKVSNVDVVISETFGYTPSAAKRPTELPETQLGTYITCALGALNCIMEEARRSTRAPHKIERGGRLDERFALAPAP
jgi:hypothetical protein